MRGVHTILDHITQREPWSPIVEEINFQENDLETLIAQSPGMNVADMREISAQARTHMRSVDAT